MPTLKKNVTAPRGARKTTTKPAAVRVAVDLPAALVRELQAKLHPLRLTVVEALQAYALQAVGIDGDVEFDLHDVGMAANIEAAGGVVGYYLQAKARAA